MRVDLLEDAGLSTSPEVDIGQVEGAFCMGLGLWTSEEIKHDPETGELLTKNTWVGLLSSEYIHSTHYTYTHLSKQVAIKSKSTSTKIKDGIVRTVPPAAA